MRCLLDSCTGILVITYALPLIPTCVCSYISQPENVDWEKKWKEFTWIETRKVKWMHLLHLY